MKIFPQKQKNNNCKDAYYFGEYGEIGVGFSLTRVLSPEDNFLDKRHIHQTADEYYLLIEGQAMFEVNDKEIIVNENTLLLVEKGEAHKLKTVTKYPCVIISVTTEKEVGEKIVLEE